MAVGCIDWLGWIVTYLVQITGLLMFWAVYSAPCGQDKEHERNSPNASDEPRPLGAVGSARLLGAEPSTHENK